MSGKFVTQNGQFFLYKLDFDIRDSKFFNKLSKQSVNLLLDRSFSFCQKPSSHEMCFFSVHMMPIQHFAHEALIQHEVKRKEGFLSHHLTKTLKKSLLSIFMGHRTVMAIMRQTL